MGFVCLCDCSSCLMIRVSFVCGFSNMFVVFFCRVVTMTIAVMLIVVVAAVSWWGFSLPYLRAQADLLLFLLLVGFRTPCSSLVFVWLVQNDGQGKCMIKI